VLECCYGLFNHDRRHSSAGMGPVNYENTAVPDREAAQGMPPPFGEPHLRFVTEKGMPWHRLTG